MNTFADAFIASMGVKINHIVGRLVEYFDPLVIQLEKVVPEVEADGDEDDTPWIVAFVPGILLMSLLFMSQGLGNDLWQEREQRTLRRIVVSPQSVVAFLAGKVVAGTCLMFGIAVVGLSIGYAYFGLNSISLPLAIAWATCSGAMLMALMMVIQLCTASQRAGNIVTLILIFPLIMLGGSFFPFEVMPSWMAAVGRFTPNGWALLQLSRIIRQEFELGRVALGFVGLGLASLVLFVIGAWRLRGGFARG
jgi:ABC-type multidrug transport system permease subunit